MAKKPDPDDKRFVMSLTDAGVNGEPPIALLFIPQAAWEALRTDSEWIDLDHVRRAYATHLLVARCTTYAQGVATALAMNEPATREAAYESLRLLQPDIAEKAATPPPSLMRAAGSLQVARRHVDRLRRGVLPLSDRMLSEMQNSIDNTLDILEGLGNPL